MTAWQDDKRWSDLYIPEVKRIVGPRLLEAAPFEMEVLARAARMARLIEARAIGRAERRGAESRNNHRTECRPGTSWRTSDR